MDSISGYDPTATRPNLDLAVLSVTGVPKRFCGNKINPSVNIYNAGAQAQQNLLFEVKIDAQLVFSQTITNLNSKQTLSLNIGELIVTQGIHTLSVSFKNQSNTDATPFNNVSNLKFEAIPNGNLTKVSVTLDDFGSENSWRIEDSQNKIVSQAGPFKDRLKTTQVVNEVCLLAGCYKFIFTDQYGDGMCCEFGNGSYVYNDMEGNQLAIGWTTPKSPSEQSIDEITSFCVSASSIKNHSSNPFRIFPNPAKNLVFVRGNDTSASLELIDLMGKLILKTTLEDIQDGLDISSLAKGIYLLKIRTENGTYTEKLVVE